MATSPSVHHILLITEVKQGRDLLVLGWVTAPKMQPDVDKILFANGCLSIRSGRHFWISIMQQLTSSPSIVLFYTKNLVSSQPEPKRQKKKTDKGLFFCIRVRKFLLPKRAVIQWSQVKNYSVLKSQFQLKTIQNFYSRKISFDSIIMHICIIQSKLPVLPGPTVGHTLRWSGAKNVERFTILRVILAQGPC